MLMRNSAPHAIKVLADLIADWGDSDGARPERVTIPAGAVVSVRDEYALRHVPPHAPRDHDTGEVITSAVVQSVASSLSGGTLKPHGADAVAFFASTFHHELPQVRREMAELARRDQAERADRWVSRDQMKAEIAEHVEAAMNKAGAALPIAPPASPRFHDE